MKIAIFGMGYVGIVSAACLVRDGHEVIGVDPVETKVKDISQGISPISEPGVNELLKIGYNQKRLSAVTEPGAGLDVDMVWICVGTPSDESGEVNLTHVETCIIQIGQELAQQSFRPLIVLRSTVPPGTTGNKVIPLLEKTSGLKVHKDIHVCFHPEFLRESSAVEDFDDPPKILTGEGCQGAADLLYEVYQDFTAPKFRLKFQEAEMVKYCDNIFHALKITFANEIGAVAQNLGLDARKVAEVYCADTKLNISTKYLKPGFAFGGSCLPKDLRALNRMATKLAVQIPMLQAIQTSNQKQMERMVSRILKLKPQTAGIAGLSFKPHTDDMRESPYVMVAKRLIGEGLALKIYDPGIDPDRLIGSNREAAVKALGHLNKLLVSDLNDLDQCDCILINHPVVPVEKIRDFLDNSIHIIDCADTGWPDREHAFYQGVAW